MGSRTWTVGLCALSILGGWSAAMEEQVGSGIGASSPGSTSQAGPQFGPLAAAREQLLGGKRAYTYRSEYKRLPVYQFGLGKRWAGPALEDKRSQPFSFGLGKRTRQFTFGLGKRSGYDDGDSRFGGYGYLPADLYDSYAQKEALENYLQGKRAGGFNFGIGKREAESDIGGYMRSEDLEDRMPMKQPREKFLFGLGKRLYGDQEEREAEAEDVGPGGGLAGV